MAPLTARSVFIVGPRKLQNHLMASGRHECYIRFICLNRVEWLVVELPGHRLPGGEREP
jgi:hypothetical protein